MSCSQATAPINITKAGSTGPCELKCDYTFNYNDSDTTVTNNGTYLSFSYDQANVPPVTFNAERYRVEEVRLYRPSLHTYDGAAADGEIIILHSSNTSKLLVCVPIIGSTAVTKSGTLLGQVMPKVGRYAATAGQTANLNVSDFNLGSLVPNKPFYSYMGTLPYSPCNGTYNYVVFDMLTPATMSPASLKIFKRVTQPNDIAVTAGNEYFYNSKGPTGTATSGDDIYIECAPTGEEGEALVNAGPKVSGFGKFQWSKITSNPYFLTIVSAVGAFILFKLARLLFRKISAVKIGRAPAVSRSSSASSVGPTEYV
jgi:carbonic anhydrase